MTILRQNRTPLGTYMAQAISLSTAVMMLREVHEYAD